MTGPTWLGVDEVAAVLDRDQAAVYRLAYRRRWRRYNYQGRTYYHPDDIEAEFARMAGNSVDRLR